MHGHRPRSRGSSGARTSESRTLSRWNFERSTKLHKLAMSHNRGLDRDKNGIACETA
jgi:hypothetical protein